MLPSYDNLLIKRFEEPDEVPAFAKATARQALNGKVTTAGSWATSRMCRYIFSARNITRSKNVRPGIIR